MSGPATLQRRREFMGPALFSYGFRPFFLSAGLWAAISLPLWLHQLSGDIALPTHFSPLQWHIHEMLFGYVAATIAGFLLTAIPNWTGRLPVKGWPLAGLATLWLAGRVAIACSAKIGAVLAAAVDISFLLTLVAVTAREIVAGKNWRNLRVVGVISALAAANVIFHAEVLTRGEADYGTRISLGAIIFLISLIGGRIVPSFTNNWLARNNPGRLPVPFSRYDALAIAVAAATLVAWIAAPINLVSGDLLMLAGIMHAVRIARWAGGRTIGNPLVLVLHVAYAFVPLGFVLVGLSTLTPAIPQSAGIHAWTAGAIGLMTLAVMTRATLGHTGQPLHAGPGTVAIYVLIFVSAISRIIAALTGSFNLIETAAVCWLLGFTLFLFVYGPLWLRRSWRTN
jgi:uncharacterized protein involved in response to NO